MAVNKFGAQVDGRFSPEIGQYFYWVDSNFRTAAQGWSRADGTGPLDLWQAREPGGDTRVYYTPETGNQGTTYASQVASFNAARDAMIDFRGDTLFVTPGAYTIAAASTWDVPYATIRGPITKAPYYGCSPKVRQASITCGVATTGTLLLGADADGLEVAHLRFIPTSAAPCFTVNAVAQNMHFHDFMWDCVGITADAGTEFMDVITTNDGIEYGLFEHFTWLVDSAVGPVFNIDVAQHFVTISHFLNINAETTGTYVTSLMDFSADGVDGIVITDGLGMVSNAGTSAVTQLTNGAAQTGTDVILIAKFYGGVNYSSGATALIAGTASDANLLNCYLGSVEGGAGGVLYTS